LCGGYRIVGKAWQRVAITDDEGEDDGANRVAAGLAEQIDFEPVYLGPLQEARLLEPLAMNWIVLGSMQTRVTIGSHRPRDRQAGHQDGAGGGVDQGDAQK
jgi:hypothetical protein